MIKVNISIGNNQTEEWDQLLEIPFEPYDSLYPNQKFSQENLYGLNKKEVKLPNKEILELGAAYDISNRGLSFVITNKNTTLLNLSSFKRDDKAWDPAFVLQTPQGEGVSFMFGPVDS